MKPQPSGDERDRRHLGLGVYTMEKIVSSHKGRMLVRSNDSEGTTYIVRLPRTAGATK